MKKLYTLIGMAAFLLLAPSCTREILQESRVEMPEEQLGPWAFLPQETHFIGNGDECTEASFSDGTKSHIVMNGAGTHAAVEWTEGDVIRMFANNGSYTTYTAESAGAQVVFSGGAELGGSPLYTLYPSTAFKAYSINSGKLSFGAYIPENQTATPGSVAEGANVSFVRVTSQDDHLAFQNIVALLKFRLSGDVVSQIKSVTFNGIDYLSGTFVVRPDDNDGDPVISSGAYYALHPRYSSVTLSGDFAEDTDYYIAVAPSVQDGFSMVFSNSDGSQTIKKFSSKRLVFNRSRITNFGTISLGDTFDAENSPAELYIEHTTAKYATIAVIPDGYTEEQLAQYETDAHAAIETIFNTEPYKSYRDHFNVWVMKVASKESGARISDGTAEEQTRDCYFQSTWGKSSYSGMTANPYRVFGFVETYCPDIVNGTHTIEEVPILLIINDTRYGGIAHNYSNGMTFCMAPKVNGTLAWSYPAQEAASVTASPGNLTTLSSEERAALGANDSGDWRNIVVHEFAGHSIGKLGDEYWYTDRESLEAVASIDSHSWDVPMSLNVSATYDAGLVPWKEFFSDDIQTKIAGMSAQKQSQYARTSVFQGASVSTFNRWRSERISCMIDNRLYFSTWQRYILVNRILKLADSSLGTFSMSLSDFLDADVPDDPLRDNLGSPVMLPDGVSYELPPHPMPMLPPPVWHEELP